MDRVGHFSVKDFKDIPFHFMNSLPRTFPQVSAFMNYWTLNFEKGEGGKGNFFFSIPELFWAQNINW